MVDLLHIGEGANITAIFKYGNGIAEGEDLFHTVRHIQNDAPLFTQLADYPEQVFDFARRQRAGWFIKGNDFGITRQGFGNLYHLPLADGEVFQRGLRVDIQPEMLQLQTGFIVEQRTVNKTALMRKLPKIDVFRHRHLRDQMQFLVDDGDARVQRGGGVGKRDFPAL